jgi:structural maintenance of chromosome 1
MSPFERKEQHRQFMEEYNERQLELEKMDPNLKAAAHFKSVQARFKKTSEACNAARQDALAADRAFKEVADKRCVVGVWVMVDVRGILTGLGRGALFMEAFTRISGCIDDVYKELTKSTEYDVSFEMPSQI